MEPISYVVIAITMVIGVGGVSYVLYRAGYFNPRK